MAGVIAAVLATCGAASATPIIYGSQASFLAAVSTSITDDYSNPGYVRSTITPNYMTDAFMTSVLHQTTYQDTQSPLNQNEVFGPFGVGNDFYYCAGCNGSFVLGFQNTSLSKSGGVFGVSFDYRDGGLPGPPNNPLFDFLVTFGDGSTIDYTVPESAPPTGNFATDFWGITSDKQITSIYFGVNGQPSHSATFGLDNLTIAAKKVAVPEPGTLWILAAGMSGMVLARRRKKVSAA